MATSSIFTNVIIKDAADADKLIRALEASERDAENHEAVKASASVSDLAAIRRLMGERHAL